MPFLFPTLIAKGLSFTYGSVIPAVSNVDLTIEPGAIHVILGHSGSGKTTLAKLLTGAIEQTAGSIHLNGQLTSHRDLRDPVARGIRVLSPTKATAGKSTVSEALQMDGIPTKFGLPDSKERNRRAAALLSSYGIGDVDPGELLCAVPAGKQALIQAAAVLSRTSSLLIFDDPTAAMTEAEAYGLYRQISQLGLASTALLWLTSRPEEALAVGDHVSVIRDGKILTTHNPEEVFVPQLEGEMLGWDMSKEAPPVLRLCGPESVLRVEGLTVDHAAFGVSLKVKRSEILGLLGLPGAGQSEVVNAIGGAIARQDGEIFLRGNALPAKLTTKAHAESFGIGLIPEPLGRPLTLHHGRPTLISGLMRSLGELHPLKAPIANCLESNCSVLLLDNPTRGLDTASRLEIQRFLPNLACQGIAMVLASTKPEELIRFSDRIAVMVNGRIVRTFERHEFSLESLNKLLKG